jgi:hypothetical protein
MQPTPDAPTPASPEPNTGSGLVERLARDRQSGGLALLGASTVLLLLALVCAIAAGRAPKDATDPATKDSDPALKLDDPEKPKNPNRGEYLLGAVVAAAGFLALSAVGAWLVVSLPPTGPGSAERLRTQARGALLAAGSGLGTVLMIGGLLFFYRWSGSLFDWLDRGQTKQARFVLVPFLAIVTGAGLAFFSVLPARAEARNNPGLRRWAYGTNFVLGTLLTFIALLLLNLIVGSRLPNRLDTTTSGFYSLSPNTVALLQKLPEPITAHVILQGDGRVSEDVRRLARNCADASGDRFAAKFLNPTTDPSDYQKLVGRYPILEANETGVLLTVGTDGKRHSFIREDEFTQRGDPRARDTNLTFVGEARLLKELLFLAENEQKAVVYFTQSAGESAVAEAPEDTGARSSVIRLKEYLGRNNLDVRPLRFDQKDPKVPDDASVVAVIEPQRAMREEHVAALRRYMTDARPGGKKGKLIVFAGAAFGPAPKYEVQPTGLEPLLAELGVRMEARYIRSEDTREFPGVSTLAGFSSAARRAKNPIAMALGEKTAYGSPLWREVLPMQQAAPGGTKATPLLFTMADRFSWLEDRLLTGQEQARSLAELDQSQAARTAKRFTDSPRPVGAIVAEGDSGRAVIVGNSMLVTDAAAEQGGGDAPGFQLFGVAVDWLRDRPALSFDVQAKTYQEFRFPATADENRGLWLPLVIGVVAVLGLGSAVWVVRRRTA